MTSVMQGQTIFCKKVKKPPWTCPLRLKKRQPSPVHTTSAHSAPAPCLRQRCWSKPGQRWWRRRRRGRRKTNRQLKWHKKFKIVFKHISWLFYARDWRPVADGVQGKVGMGKRDERRQQQCKRKSLKNVDFFSFSRSFTVATDHCRCCWFWSG